jgi:hypothetical protein
MQAAYKRTKKVLSRFIKVWFRGFPDIVTAEHLANMDIAPIDDTKTPVPKPDNQVEADLTFPGIHLVELAKIRPASGTPPDPRSDYGVRIYFGFSGPPQRGLPLPPDEGSQERGRPALLGLYPDEEETFRL